MPLRTWRNEHESSRIPIPHLLHHPCPHFHLPCPCPRLPVVPPARTDIAQPEQGHVRIACAPVRESLRTHHRPSLPASHLAVSVPTLLLYLARARILHDERTRESRTMHCRGNHARRVPRMYLPADADAVHNAHRSSPPCQRASLSSRLHAVPLPSPFPSSLFFPLHSPHSFLVHLPLPLRPVRMRCHCAFVRYSAPSAARVQSWAITWRKSNAVFAGFAHGKQFNGQNLVNLFMQFLANNAPGLLTAVAPGQAPQPAAPNPAPTASQPALPPPSSQPSLPARPTAPPIQPYQSLRVAPSSLSVQLPPLPPLSSSSSLSLNLVVQIMLVDDNDTIYLGGRPHSLLPSMIASGTLSFRTYFLECCISASFLLRAAQASYTTEEPCSRRQFIHHWLLCQSLNGIDNHTFA
ncbi:hypothetical protein B0H16DRAFT_1747764 [Mycena metata]|uniref:Uncharacterized protein n=1 Tax=Mycena metata TaxID=1033252 RepID=A0AAD7DZZ9_9AGAR|nr:hypothetical protein B0H16DRAFT_1748010 [Mycena metata]KAJ7704142.1 hypothetical protein B0H16DRAFT_1747764 [Mycena metata]